jgi:hypothetical protein
MPAKSAKQKRFMQAVANNPTFANKVGVPQSVGAEYTKENKMKKKMNMGGPVADAAGARAMDPRMAMAMEAQRRQAAMGGMKEGGKVEGPAKSAKYAAMKGAAFGGGPEGVKKLKEEITAAAKKVKSKLKMKKGGMVSSASKRADGCITKGRTRGRMV